MGRKLEIGPGQKLPGFEGVDIVPNKSAEMTADARKLPYPDKTFVVVYASHVIEHFPWYETVDVLREWTRVLAVGGQLEIWTVNAIVVAKQLIAVEEGKVQANPDGWKRCNPTANPYLWCAGRLFAHSAYTVERVNVDSNWHKALFTPRYLISCFKAVGLADIRLMNRSEVRAHDHGIINLGVCGTRK